MPLFFTGSTINGSADDDFIFGHPSGGAAHTLNGGDGDDFITGDSDFIFSTAGTSSANALDITTNTLPWSQALNLDIANSTTIPHTTIYAAPAANTTLWYSVTVVAGQTITVDIDYGNHVIGGSSDVFVRIVDTDGTSTLATDDDSLLTEGGLGSTSTRDPFLQYTFAADGTYFIEIGEFPNAATFGGGETFLANISLTGQAFTSDSPIEGIDTIDGGIGNDVIHGGGGEDNILGGADNDTIVDAGQNTVDAGSGDDTVILLFALGGTFDGGSGSDTLDLSRDAFVNQTYDLSAASFTIFGAQFSNFENVIDNGGSNNIVGNSLANTIQAGGGADDVDAGAGNDTVIDTDGVSFDSYNGGDDFDTLNYSDAPIANGTTYNLVAGTVTFGAASDTFQEFERLFASAANEILISDGLSEVFMGDGNDYVFAGAGTSESLSGGAGDDTIDTSLQNVNYTINLLTGLTNFAGETFSAFEHVVTGSGNDAVTGNGANNNIRTGAGTDTIEGGSGNDTLDGGADADDMSGGANNDVYFVDDAGDFVNESAGQGTDGVVSSISFTLPSFVENIQLTGTANINATGNSDANRLIGNSGNNVLNGMGGVDFMQGLAGNDVYWVDSLGESVVEAAGQGIDGVVSTITYTLPVNVENLQLIGTANINGFGNAEINRLIGNSGNNTLNGLAGADIMQGLNGNDVYWVDDVGDSILETSLAGSGIDGVITSVNYTLAVNVENLSLGGASTTGVGNASNNTITGNGLNNVINGLLGYDVLIGGGGDDKFIMNSSITGGPNFDYLKDFNDVGNDEIRLENAIYTALTATGFLSANLFKDIGTGAQDADDVILYNSTTGALFYDANGLAAGGIFQFAVVDVGTTVTAADFFVI